MGRMRPTLTVSSAIAFAEANAMDAIAASAHRMNVSSNPFAISVTHGGLLRHRTSREKPQSFGGGKLVPIPAAVGHRGVTPLKAALWLHDLAASAASFFSGGGRPPLAPIIPRAGGLRSLRDERHDSILFGCA